MSIVAFSPRIKIFLDPRTWRMKSKSQFFQAIVLDKILIEMHFNCFHLATFTVVVAFFLFCKSFYLKHSAKKKHCLHTPGTPNRIIWFVIVKCFK